MCYRSRHTSNGQIHWTYFTLPKMQFRTEIHLWGPFLKKSSSHIGEKEVIFTVRRFSWDFCSDFWLSESLSCTHHLSYKIWNYVLCTSKVKIFEKLCYMRRCCIKRGSESQLTFLWTEAGNGGCFWPEAFYLTTYI